MGWSYGMNRTCKTGKKRADVQTVEGEKDGDGGLHRRHLKGVREELRKRATYGSNWKLLINNVVRKKKKEENRQWKLKSWSTHP